MSFDGIECCGNLRKSRYCPECGKALRKHDVFTLLQHCRTKLNECEKQRERDKEDGNERGYNIRTTTVNKWSAWVDVLESVIRNEDN